MSKPDCYYDALGLLGDSLPDFVEDYLDGVATDAQREALAAWLRDSDANVACFAQLAFLDSAIGSILTSRQHAQDAQDAQLFDPQSHVSLADQLALLEPREPVALVDFTEESKRRGLKKRKAKAADDRRRMRLKQSQSSGADSRGLVISKVAIWLGLAAALGLVIWLGRPDPQAPQANPEVASRDDSADRQALVAPIYVAHVAHSIDAQWEGLGPSESRLEAGKRMVLRSGIAEIIFSDGTTVLIQAPATFRPTGPNGLRLIEGRLTTQVPDDAPEFEVTTPHMLLTGTDTEFGVTVDRRRGSVADVFAGRVVARDSMGESPRVDLLTGHAVQTDRLGELTKRFEWSSTMYYREIETFALAPLISGQGVYLRSMPAQLAFHTFESTSDIAVMLEQRSVQWQDRWLIDDAFGLGPVGGQPVDIFMVHFDPVGSQELTGQDISREVILTFDRPILGVISSAELLLRSDSDLGRAGTQYTILEGNSAHNQRGMDVPDDSYRLENNGQTLRVRMTAGTHIDQMRVIVASKENEIVRRVN